MRLLALPSCLLSCLIAAGCASTDASHSQNYASGNLGSPAQTTGPETAPVEALITDPGPVLSTARSADSLSTRQDVAIERWQECLTSNQQRLGYTFESAGEIASKVVFICHGHATDVLLTFPENLRAELRNILKEQAYVETLEHLAYRNRVADTTALGQSILLNP